MIALTITMNLPAPFFRVLLLAFALTAGATASAQNWQWAKGEGDIGNDAANAVATDNSGNTYITGNIAGKADFSGTVYQGNGIYDMYVAKYNAAGDLLWVKLAGGRGNDQGNSIKWANGFLYVCGSFEDTAWFGTTALISKGSTDAFLAKYDNGGNLIWVKTAGGTGSDYASSLDVANGGQIIVAGAYEQAMALGSFNLSTTNGYYESFYAAYNGNGAVQWAQTTTGTNANLITGVAFDHNNALYLTGYFGGNFKVGTAAVNSSSASYDIFLAKVNESDGTLNWLKRAGSSYEDGAHGVSCDADGYPTIAGYFAGTAYFDNNTVSYTDYNDVFTARYDTAGNNLWVRAGKGQFLDIAFGVTSDAAGNCFVTGMFQQAINFNGNILSASDRDIFIISYDKYGNIRWLDKAGGMDTDCGLGIALQNNGSLAVCGYYLRTCFFGSIQIDYAAANDLFAGNLNPPPVGIAGATEDLGITLFPNPSGSNFSLQIAGNVTPGSYNIFNAVGAIILSGDLTAHNRFNLQNHPAGVYFLQVLTPRGTETIRLVKE